MHAGRMFRKMQSSCQRKRLRKAARHASRQLRAMCSQETSALTEGAQAPISHPCACEQSKYVIRMQAGSKPAYIGITHALQEL